MGNHFPVGLSRKAAPLVPGDGTVRAAPRSSRTARAAWGSHSPIIREALAYRQVIQYEKGPPNRYRCAAPGNIDQLCYQLRAPSPTRAHRTIETTIEGICDLRNRPLLFGARRPLD